MSRACCRWLVETAGGLAGPRCGRGKAAVQSGGTLPCAHVGTLNSMRSRAVPMDSQLASLSMQVALQSATASLTCHHAARHRPRVAHIECEALQGRRCLCPAPHALPRPPLRRPLIAVRHLNHGRRAAAALSSLSPSGRAAVGTSGSWCSNHRPKQHSRPLLCMIGSFQLLMYSR